MIPNARTQRGAPVVGAAPGSAARSSLPEAGESERGRKSVMGTSSPVRVVAGFS